VLIKRFGMGNADLSVGLVMVVAAAVSGVGSGGSGGGDGSGGSGNEILVMLLVKLLRVSSYPTPYCTTLRLKKVQRES
jgi:hypothetical protein